MFGHQDDKDEDNKATHDGPSTDPLVSNDPADSGPDTGSAKQIGKTISPAGTDTDSSTQDDGSAPEAAPQSDDAWQHPGVPIDNDSSEKDKDAAPIRDVIAPANGGKASFELHTSGGGGHNFSDSGDDHGHDDANTPHELIDIKQKALTQLSPLIDKLDQTPEDKFRTTMMMIQASDDQSLVKQAYESANAIEDEKAKAQALLDIVNEINYFTQHPDN